MSDAEPHNRRDQSSPRRRSQERRSEVDVQADTETKNNDAVVLLFSAYLLRTVPRESWPAPSFPPETLVEPVAAR
jgi:hypothetical protein